MRANEIAIEGQTLLDLSVQSNGTIEAVFDLAVLNGISITAALVPGQKIVINDAPFNIEVYKYYQAHGIKPATGGLDNDFLQKLFENGLFENGLFE